MTKPCSIQLTESEKQLLSGIDFHPSLQNAYETRLANFEACHDLTLSLDQRNAIPKARWSYFTDPQHNIGSKRSHKQVFEGNGTLGEDIFRHPHFLPFLRYFLYGPDLPESTIEGFSNLVGESEPVTSGDISEFSSYARQEVRTRGLDRRASAEEFHKLALECGLEGDWARQVRDAVFRLR